MCAEQWVASGSHLGAAEPQRPTMFLPPTPISCVVRKGVLKTGSQEAHPEVPTSFLALTLAAEAVWYVGRRL